MFLKKLFLEMCMLIYKYVYIYIIKMYVNNDWIDLCYFFQNNGMVVLMDVFVYNYEELCKFLFNCY